MKNLILFLTVTAMFLGLGCAAISEYVTPATVDPKAVAYASQAGVVDANSFQGWANLEKAIRLEAAVGAAYEVNTLALAQMAEKNQLDYNLLRGVVTRSLEIARSREAQLFGETGLLSMGLSLLGVGGAAGILGLMRKRPGDITPQEFELAVAETGHKVTDKERQLMEVVRGVQQFLNAHKDEAVAGELKTTLARTQSADTKEVIAIAKVSA